MAAPLRPRLAFALVLLAALAAPALAAPEGEKTNVVILFTDDLGYGDLGCYGGTVPTPNLARMAAGGALFTQAYAAAPVCTPSRVGLFTGQHPARLGVQANTGDNQLARKRARGMPAEALTFAERLRGLGYRTGLVGKWHLGLSEGMTPVDQGFDEFFGFLGAAHRYVPNDDDVRMIRGARKLDEFEQEYLTDAWAREAEAFIERNKAQPFVLTVCFNAPHTPHEASENYLERFPKLKGDKRTYAAMISALDDAIGRILAKLEAEGLAQRTLVCFSNDNGAPIDQGPGTNGEYRMGKAMMFEGGSRVPLILRWPERVEAGARITTPVSLLDLAATTLALAGAPAETLAELDGVDLAPLLAGGQLPERALFWKLGPSAAIRRGAWKLVTSNASRWLFDVEADPQENVDLLEQQPEIAGALAKELGAWTAELPKQRWKNEEFGKPIRVLGKPYWIEY
jgi:arylsulfatase A-like enzyme